jgi:malate permease and related proteins
MHVFNSLMPVFLLIALGKGLTRTSFFTEDLARNINRLTYWVALPALLLSKITNAVFNAGEVSSISAVLILATICSAFVAMILAKLFKMNRRSAGAFVQGSSRSNNAFIGLPVIIYSLASSDPHLEGVATLALAPAIVFYNIFSVTVLLAYGDQKQKSARDVTSLFIKQILTNPLLLACAFGLLFNFIGFKFPIAIDRSLTALGNAALALALLSIGSSLTFKGLSEGLWGSILSSSIKVFIQPAIGLGLALLFGLSPIDRQILLIYLACPTAVASFVLADIFDSDRELAGHIIVVSTLLSAVSLTLIIALGS